jgi:glucose-6-phosphate dehydrogenase assembly protein OpcA
MTIAYKILGQSNPIANTETTLYTVPANTSVVASTLNICNQSSSSATFRIAVRVAGSAISNEEYIAYDITLGASDTTVLTMGVTMNATDVLSVYASSATVAFQAFGSEIS